MRNTENYRMNNRSGPTGDHSCDHLKQATAFHRRSSLAVYDKTDNRTERAPTGSSNRKGYQRILIAYRNDCHAYVSQLV